MATVIGTKLITLDTLRVFKVRRELLNGWYEASTGAAPRLMLVVRPLRPERLGLWEAEDGGQALVLAESAIGLAVGSHPRSY